MKPLITVDATCLGLNQLIAEGEQTDFPLSKWLEKILIMGKEKILFTPQHTLSFGFIRGNEYQDEERFSETIDADALRSGGHLPMAGDAFILGCKIKPATLKDLGLRTFVLMHEPMTDLCFTRDKFRLGLCFESNGKHRLEACYGRVGGGRFPDTGFVYLMNPPLKL